MPTPDQIDKPKAPSLSSELPGLLERMSDSDLLVWSKILGLPSHTSIEATQAEVQRELFRVFRDAVAYNRVRVMWRDLNEMLELD